MSIHHNLRQLRLDSGMTQEQAAEKICVTRQTISSYESGRTQPDIDVLIRLCDVYGTDLDGIIYGRNRVLTSIRRVTVTAKAIFVLLTILTSLSSALLWSANHFFAIPEGQMSLGGKAILLSRQRLIGAWEIVDGILLSISLLGFAFLLLLLLIGKCVFPVKVKITYMITLAAVLFAVAILFGAADTVFVTVDYIMTPALVIGRMLFFFAVDLIIQLVQKKPKMKPDPRRKV